MVNKKLIQYGLRYGKNTIFKEMSKMNFIIKELLEFIDKECRRSHDYCDEEAIEILANNKCNCIADKQNLKIDNLIDKHREYLEK